MIGHNLPEIVFGNPLQREPERVARDVELGYVTPQAALDDYGIVADASGKFDAAATKKRRDGLG